jgi:hypothetical protein
MAQLNFEEWNTVIDKTAERSQNLEIDEIISSLIHLKGKDFFKNASIISKEGVFYHILENCKLLK